MMPHCGLGRSYTVRCVLGVNQARCWSRSDRATPWRMAARIGRLPAAWPCPATIRVKGREHDGSIHLAQDFRLGIARRCDASPAILATGKTLPSDRVRIGLIGCGGRGRELLAVFGQFADVAVPVISDVFDPRMNKLPSSWRDGRLRRNRIGWSSMSESSIAEMSMRCSSPLRSTGTACRSFRPRRPASTFMWRSPSRTR